MCNQFLICLDKFSDTVFIIILTGLGVWNFVKNFFHKDWHFNHQVVLLSLTFIFMACLLLGSLTGNVTVLTYFGFLRGKVSKAIFLLFCSCMTLPGSGGNKDTDGPTGSAIIGYPLSFTLIAASILQIVKFLEKDETLDRLNEGNLKVPIK